jgi:hypothetical protein
VRIYLIDALVWGGVLVGVAAIVWSVVAFRDCRSRCAPKFPRTDMLPMCVCDERLTVPE